MNSDKIIDAVLWQRIKWFTPAEFGRDYNKVEFDLVVMLDRLRTLIGAPITIKGAFATTGHSKKSQHYLGRAADINIKGVSLLDAFNAAVKIGFTGIGVYPFWRTPGLHVDIRDSKQPVYWIRDAAEKYHYKSVREITEYLSK
jgi:hypothetical protein